jgi:hypothetical protein
MILNDYYIAPQLAAATVYAHMRSGYTHAFTRMGISSSARSFDKPNNALTLTQTCKVELETFEPYQAYLLFIDVDLRGNQGEVCMHGSNLDTRYVFPSDSNALELWLVQFKYYLRNMFGEDKNND